MKITEKHIRDTIRKLANDGISDNLIISVASELNRKLDKRLSNEDLGKLISNTLAPSRHTCLSNVWIAANTPANDHPVFGVWDSLQDEYREWRDVFERDRTRGCFDDLRRLEEELQWLANALEKEKNDQGTD